MKSMFYRGKRKKQGYNTFENGKLVWHEYSNITTDNDEILPPTKSSRYGPKGKGSVQVDVTHQFLSESDQTPQGQQSSPSCFGNTQNGKYTSRSLQ